MNLIVAVVIAMIGSLISAILYVAIVPQASVSSSYSQFDVFRDMEPKSQIRENPWVGFIQEDVRRTSGSLGDFTGNDSSTVWTYPF